MGRRGVGGGLEDQAGAVRHHLDDLVAELPEDDDDPGGRVVVLGGGPDEADCAQHLDDVPGELGYTAQTAGEGRPRLLCPQLPLPTASNGTPEEDSQGGSMRAEARGSTTPCWPTLAPPTQPVGIPSSAYHGEVGLLHLLQ